MSPTPTAATPTPEQRAYAIVQPLTVDSVTRRDELVTRIAAAIRQHSDALRAESERLTKERDELRARDLSWSATFSRLDAEANADAQKLAASQESERKMREALTEVARLRLATDEGTLAKRADRMWQLATDMLAALQPQETDDGR